MAQISPVDVVRDLWQRFERDGVDGALNHIDDDVVYLVQLAGGHILRGSAEVRALLSDFEARGMSLDARLETLEGRGDAVIASGTVRVDQPAGTIESQYHWVFHFAGGRLRRLSIYAAREEALASLAALNAIAPPPPEFMVAEDVEAGVHVLRPTGELDIDTVRKLETALLEGRSAGDRVLLDLGALEFIDSTGLRTIVRAAEAAQRGRWELRLRHGGPAVRRVFEFAGLIDAFPFEPS
jgi:anti-anti-sigma factor